MQRLFSWNANVYLHDINKWARIWDYEDRNFGL